MEILRATDERINLERAVSLTRQYLFVNGAYANVSDNWTDRACAWISANTPDKADDFEYFTTATMRNLTAWWLAWRLSRRLAGFIRAGRPIHIVAHSNGATVFLDALRRLGYPEIARLHLISPSCSEDGEVSGLARVNCEMITIYRGGNDAVLKLADLGVANVFGFDDFGAYGAAVKGMENAASFFEAVDDPEAGHSSWFAGERFEKLMRRITGIGEPPVYRHA